MKRKILIASVVLAAGLVTFLAYDSRAGEMLRNAMSDFDYHVPKLISSTFSLLSAMQIGIIIMVIVLTLVTIFMHGGDKDKI